MQCQFIKCSLGKEQHPALNLQFSLTLCTEKALGKSGKQNSFNRKKPSSDLPTKIISSGKPAMRQNIETQR